MARHVHYNGGHSKEGWGANRKAGYDPEDIRNIGSTADEEERRRQRAEIEAMDEADRAKRAGRRAERRNR